MLKVNQDFLNKNNINERNNSASSVNYGSTSEIECFLGESSRPNNLISNEGIKENLENAEVHFSKPDEISRNMESDLAQWAVKHVIPHAALGDLLLLLRKHQFGASLPKDPRTLLKTPRSTEISAMHPGSYCQFGISSGIKETFDFEGLEFVSEIKLKVGIDGLPLSQSNTNQLWPILGNILPSKLVFVIGVYYGCSKPSDANAFLGAFVSEINELINNGFNYRDKSWPVQLQCIVCDAPAKSFIQKTKAHNAYFGCTKCIQEGEYIDNRMCYPERQCTKRTDESFNLQLQEEYHSGHTVLSTIKNFGMVSRIPLDYMHLVCIGVVKKIILMWMKGPYNVRLSNAKVKVISSNLLGLRPFIVKEFARRPQELHNVSKWKATELRQFILYTCFIVLKDVLPPYLLSHIMTLHVALKILTQRVLLEKYLDYAESLLEHFVETFEIIYGKQFLSHNIHGLIHLADDARVHGTLDNFSAFPFENKLGMLKKCLRKPGQPLQQLHRRSFENNISNKSVGTTRSKQFQLNNEHTEGPLTKGIGGCQYKSVQGTDFRISINEPENCVAIGFNETFVIVKNIVCCNKTGQVFLIGNKFLCVESLYNVPCDSRLINCASIQNLSTELEMWCLNDLVMKCLYLPWEKGFAAFPLAHNG